MKRNRRKIEDELQHEIAIARHIEAVRRYRIEAELLAHELAIDRHRRPRERRRAERKHVDALAAVTKPFAVALKFFDVRQEVVRRQNGLRPLKMRVPG